MTVGASVTSALVVVGTSYVKELGTSAIDESCCADEVLGGPRILVGAETGSTMRSTFSPLSSSLDDPTVSATFPTPASGAVAADSTSFSPRVFRRQTLLFNTGLDIFLQSFLTPFGVGLLLFGRLLLVLFLEVRELCGFPVNSQPQFDGLRLRFCLSSRQLTSLLRRLLLWGFGIEISSRPSASKDISGSSPLCD